MKFSAFEELPILCISLQNFFQKALVLIEIIAKSYESCKTANIVFISIRSHRHISIWDQNILHIRNQREKLHRLKLFLRKFIFTLLSRFFRSKTLPVTRYSSVYRRKLFLVKITWIGVLFYADYEYAIYFGLILRYDDENAQIWLQYLQFYMTHMVLLLSQSKQGLFEKEIVAVYS